MGCPSESFFDTGLESKKQILYNVQNEVFDEEVEYGSRLS
jgi:hypothetical protein